MDHIVTAPTKVHCPPEEDTERQNRVIGTVQGHIYTAEVRSSALLHSGFFFGILRHLALLVYALRFVAISSTLDVLYILLKCEHSEAIGCGVSCKAAFSEGKK